MLAGQNGNLRDRLGGRKGAIHFQHCLAGPSLRGSGAANLSWVCGGCNSVALGIGANAAIFSLIEAVMLRSLRVSHPQELLQVTMGPQETAETMVRVGDFFGNPIWDGLRNRQDVFSAVFAFGRWGLNLAPGGQAHVVNGYFVSDQFFETLSVRAVLGRTLTPDDKRRCPGGAV